MPNLSETELLTERTRLTIPGPELAPQVLAFYLENREHFKPTYPPVPENYHTLDYVEKALAKGLDSADRGSDIRFYAFEIHDAQKILATIQISAIVRGPMQAAYLGFSAAKVAEGKGLMFEAVGRVIQFCFEDLHLHRLMANRLPGNLRSQKLMERLGLQVEGTAKNYLFINGEWRDHVLTSLTNPNWRPRAEEEAYFSPRP